MVTTYTNDCARDKGSLNSNFTLTNYTSSYTLDCNGNSDLATADVLGSVIRELIAQGILKGSVSTA